MANKKILDLDQLKTSLSAVNDWTNEKIINATNSCEKIQNKITAFSKAYTGNPIIINEGIAGNKLNIRASFGPTQSGTGDPSPTNIRPISTKRTITISRQEDGKSVKFSHQLYNMASAYIYNNNNGYETWSYQILTGTGLGISFTANRDNTKWYSSNDSFSNIDNYDNDSPFIICSHFTNKFFSVGKEEGDRDMADEMSPLVNVSPISTFATADISSAYNYIYTTPELMSEYFSTVDELNTYLKEQYNSDNPVTIAYKLKDPILFTATNINVEAAEDGLRPAAADDATCGTTAEKESIDTQIDGTNTISTDADELYIEQELSFEDLQYPSAQSIKEYVDQKIAEVSKVFVGSSFYKEGEKGLVPAPPMKMMQSAFALDENTVQDTSYECLTSDGSWQYIYMSEKLNKSGGTMSGQLIARANTAYTTYQVRNIAFSKTASVPTGNGSILGVYS